MLTLGNIVLKQTHFYQEIAEEERQKGFQRGFEEGFQEGFQEGLQEYRQEQNSKMVSRMIRHKFGINTESHQAEQKLSALSIEQLGYPLKTGHTTHTGNAEPQLGNVECADTRQAGAWRSQPPT